MNSIGSLFHEYGKPRFVGEKKFLRNRIEYVRGVTYKAAVDLHKELDEDSYMLLRANNIQGGALVLDDVQFVDRSKVKPKQLLKKGDILVCASSGSKGLVGKAALVREDMVATFGAFCCVLRAVDCSPEYLAHYFSSKQYRNAIEEACTGSNINNLKAGIFATLIVPAYSEADERSIVELLDAVSGQICKTRKQIEKLDQLVKSRFVEMFGNGNHYPQIKIGDVFRTSSGGTPSSKKKAEYYEGGTIPWLTSGEVNQECITKTKGFITQLGLEHSSAKWTPANSVVIAMYGATAGKSGLLAIQATTNQAVCAIWPQEDFVPAYLLQAVRQKESWLIEQTAGGAQPNISQAIIKRMPLAQPPLQLQQEFADFAAQVDKSRFVAQQQIEKLQMLYNSLAQDYFGD